MIPLWLRHPIRWWRRRPARLAEKAYLRQQLDRVPPISNVTRIDGDFVEFDIPDPKEKP